MNDTNYVLGVRTGENTEHSFSLEFTLLEGWGER